MRVGHFSGYVDPHGRRPEELMESWTTLVDVAEAVARTGLDVAVLQAARHDEEIERGGVRFRFVKEPRYPSPRRLLGHRAAPHPWRTIRRARALGVDVLHVHGLSFPLQVRALASALPDTAILVQDHADRVARGWRRRMQRWGLEPVAGAVFTAREQAEPFRRAGVLRSGTPVFEVLEGSSRFAPSEQGGARSITGVRGEPTVLWIGHLTPGKDPIAALEAVSEVRRDMPGLRLWMVYRRADLEPVVRSWLDGHPNAAEAVHLIGAVPHEQVPAFMGAADLLLSTSHREGSGYAVIEAHACGLPTVLSDIAPHRRIVRGLDAATLVPVGDAGGFARALRAAAAGVGDAARSSVRRHFEAELSFDAVGRQLAEAYRSVVDSRSDVAIGAGA